MKSMNNPIESALQNWIPYKLLEEADDAHCQWLYVGNETFTEPFFDSTIAKCKQLPQNSHLIKSISHIDVLPIWSESIDTLSPTAIIFHISRCGSTLLSQLLGLNPPNTMLSEVPFFDDVLRWNYRKKSVEGNPSILQSAINFYGAKRNNQQQHLFIKTDSWHIHFYNQYRQLYPNIPFILLYRRPDEVISSHQKLRGMQSVPGLIEPEIFGIDKSSLEQKNMDEYMAMVIETYLSAFITILQEDPMAIPINYNEGMENIVQKVAVATKMKIDTSALTEMKTRLHFHSKHPEQVFAENSLPVKNPPLHIDRCFAMYHELENIRLKRPPTS